MKPHQIGLFSRSLRLFLYLPLIICGIVPAISAADSLTLDDAVRQLAERVAAIPNLRGPFHLEFRQDSHFSSDTAKEWQEVFRKEMVGRNVPLTDDPNAASLRVGVSETPTQLVLSASARIGDKDEVRFLSFSRASFRATSLPVAPVRIERQLVYQTPDRILDASDLWNGAEAGMAVLLAGGAEFFIARIDPSGRLVQTIPVVSTGLGPSRDTRGELALRGDGGTVVLPAKSCDFTWASGVASGCRAAKSAGRATTVLTPSCDAGGWKLLADGGDWFTTDVLQVVPDTSLREGSAALLSDFPGPILSVAGEQNPASALVVTRNLQTGDYEVYKITLACGN